MSTYTHPADSVPPRRILAVFALATDRPASLGLVEKAESLVRAAKAYGLHVDAVATRAAELAHWHHECSEAWSLPDNTVNVKHLRLAQIYRYSGLWRDLRKFPLSAYDAVWVRAFPTSPAQLLMLRAARAAGCRVVVDLPTYPYHYRGPNLLNRSASLLAAGLDTVRARLTDRFVTLSPDEELWRVPTIWVRNGAPAPKSRAPTTSPSAAPIRIVGTGQWTEAHGVDRLLQSVCKLMRSGEVRISLAGAGPALGALRRTCKRLSIEVDWLPPVFGARRTSFLQSGDLGLGALSHPTDAVRAYFPLKHRLYASLGLPFVGTALDLDFRRHPGMLSVMPGQRLEANTLLAWAHSARLNRDEIGEALQTTARQLSWTTTYAPLFDYLAGGTS